MSDRLAAALRQKETFLKLEGHLLRKARAFYRLGFTPKNLSSSQMSAIGERIQTLGSLEDIKKAVSKFLNRQMEKLETQKMRSGKLTSWLIVPSGTGGDESLGATLHKWINDEKYLGNRTETGEIDNLVALRRFWSNVYGQYCYQKIFNQDMPLEEERLS